jgi:hypothetical protein
MIDSTRKELSCTLHRFKRASCSSPPILKRVTCSFLIGRTARVVVQMGSASGGVTESDINNRRNCGSDRD